MFVNYLVENGREFGAQLRRRLHQSAVRLQQLLGLWRCICSRNDTDVNTRAILATIVIWVAYLVQSSWPWGKEIPVRLSSSDDFLEL